MDEEQMKQKGEPQADLKARNPFIENFCRALVVKFQGDKLEGEGVEKSTDKLYKLFEYILGRKMVEALPEDKRKEYLSLTEDLGDLNYQRIGEIFGDADIDIEEIMKEAMTEVAETYTANL